MSNFKSMDVDESDDEEMPTFNTLKKLNNNDDDFDMSHNTGVNESKLKSIDVDDLYNEMNDNDNDDNEPSINKLLRSWINERNSPFVLEWKGDLCDEVMSQIEEQVKIVDSLKGDDRSTDEEHFQLLLVQTEVERAKYILTSYVRVRLHKIEQYAQYVVNNPSVHTNLSGIELSHARKYWRLIENHFSMSVLQALPSTMRGLDDNFGNKTMIPEPNYDTAVFIRAKRNVGEVQLPQQSINLMKNDKYLVRYSDIAYLLSINAVELV